MSSYPFRPRHARAHGARPAAAPAVPPAKPPAHAPATVPAVSGETVFSQLIPPLQRAVTEEGYRIPTPIQAQAIPHLLEGRDLLGCAQTGTGKTAAFVLPILQRLQAIKKAPVPHAPRVLVLAPTRELAAQIGESVRAYGRHVSPKYTVVFGGVGQHPQVQVLRTGVDILVATPGRMLDLMQQGHIRLTHIEIFVLDEADRMLDMGFIRDIRRIIAVLPPRRQTLFFSATMPPAIVDLSGTLLKNPARIAIEPEKPTVDRIAQKVMFVDKDDKERLLISLLRDRGIDKAIVFARTKHGANKVEKKLNAAGVAAAVIHGNKSQGARTTALEQFRTGRVRVLVATDIAARGIDVDGITHVINFDIPVEPETYVHRVGRTARAGAAGDALSFCCATEREALRDIERMIRRSIPQDHQHPWHSEPARLASGAAARPPPKNARPARLSFPPRRPGARSRGR